MNIATLLSQIKSDEIVLPAIQRDFVWGEAKIQKLLDSIMRGYPIGIVLMWETYYDIQYRRFADSAPSGAQAPFFDNTGGKRLRLVLDGQQRLQSLYVALYGTFASQYLYFDVLSGRDSDDFEEDKYFFYFMTSENAHKQNEYAEKVVESAGADGTESFELQYLVKVADLFAMSALEKAQFQRQVSRSLGSSEEDELRLMTNIAKLDEVLTKDQNILKASIIDEDKAPTSSERQTESDVLEIFVRINRQGTPLSRSDLIFSMLKLNWKESATELPEFVDNINEGNSFELDIDFVIRCLYAVSGLGTKFDIDLLRKKSNMDKMRSSFEQCCEAIRSTIDHVQQYCWISSSKALGGNQNLIPFVYYFFARPKHDLPNVEIERFRKTLYLFGFSSPFSRYAEGRLNRFIRSELEPRLVHNDYTLPFEAAVSWVNYWERVDGWGEDLVGRNPRLALHVIQNQSGAKTHSSPNALELDHIFPRSTLRQKASFEEWEINHFANFWLLPKGKNINKSNRHPKQYLEDVSDQTLNEALIDRNLLDYRRYRAFLRQRSKSMVQTIEQKVGLSDEDFET